MGTNLFTTDFSGEAAAPDLRHQFSDKQSQTSDKLLDNRLKYQNPSGFNF